MKIERFGEDALVRRIAKRFAVDRSVLVGIGDDTAVLEWKKDTDLLFTCDMLIEDVHFTLKTATPFQIGWKALAVNISDIAAMGGIPRYAVVSVGLRPDSAVSFVDGIFRGIGTLARKFGVNIVGGDTNKSRKLVIDISLLGEVKKKDMVRRSGAKVGDAILLTGALGGSVKGRHLTFVPRLDESRKIVGTFRVHSMIDVSDGLSLDLYRVLKASSCGARIYENCIPLSRDAGSFEEAIADGEDFELLFTMEPREARRFFKEALADFGTDVSLIGEIVEGRKGLTLVRSDGSVRSLRPKGYTHF